MKKIKVIIILVGIFVAFYCLMNGADERKKKGKQNCISFDNNAFPGHQAPDFISTALSEW